MSYGCGPVAAQFATFEGAPFFSSLPLSPFSPPSLSGGGGGRRRKAGEGGGEEKKEEIRDGNCGLGGGIGNDGERTHSKEDQDSVVSSSREKEFWTHRQKKSCKLLQAGDLPM